jgi:hypothetical protein
MIWCPSLLIPVLEELWNHRRYQENEILSNLL